MKISILRLPYKDINDLLNLEKYDNIDTDIQKFSESVNIETNINSANNTKNIKKNSSSGFSAGLIIAIVIPIALVIIGLFTIDVV